MIETPNSTAQADESTAARPRRRIMLLAWSTTLVLLVALNLYPVRSMPIRLALVVLPIVLVIWAALLWLPRRVAAAVMFILCGLAAVMFTMPEPRIDLNRPPPNAYIDRIAPPAEPVRLRGAYVRSLLRYEGAKYVWGGETNRGIDCSGLIRCGLIDATLREGIRERNPGLVRESISLWWSDLSAQALGEGAGGRAEHVFDAESINSIDPSRLQPGYFAVTSDSAHVLVFVGGRAWIEADPHEGRVLRVETPSANPWFHRRVRILFWKQLVTNFG